MNIENHPLRAQEQTAIRVILLAHKIAAEGDRYEGDGTALRDAIGELVSLLDTVEATPA